MAAGSGAHVRCRIAKNFCQGMFGCHFVSPMFKTREASGIGQLLLRLTRVLIEREDGFG